MTIPEITDEAGWREWRVAPRKGLLTSEIAPLIGRIPSAIREDIRSGRLPGVALKSQGITFAYAASVDDIITVYELAAEAGETLRNLTQADAQHKVMYLGIPFLHTMGDRIEFTIPTEFEDSQEFQLINGEILGQN